MRCEWLLTASRLKSANVRTEGAKRTFDINGPKVALGRWIERISDILPTPSNFKFQRVIAFQLVDNIKVYAGVTYPKRRKPVTSALTWSICDIVDSGLEAGVTNGTHWICSRQHH